jgi:hypothetical protein
MGASSPAISRSRVDLPTPLRPTRPERPAPTAKLSPSKRALPSGHAKDRSEQVMEMEDIHPRVRGAPPPAH